MKKIFITLSLLFCLQPLVSAQGLYDFYKSYDNIQKEDNTANYLFCREALNMSVMFSSMPLINKAPMAEQFLPSMTGTLAQNYGFSMTADYLLPIWGPLGISFNWLDLTMSFGNWDVTKLKTGVASDSKQDAMLFSWGIGVMPTFAVNFGNASLRLFGGIKGYISFFDGPNGYPLNSSNESKRKSIGSFAYANFIAGADLMVTKVFGFRFTYQWGWTNRLKDNFYDPTKDMYKEYNQIGAVGREMYNPRYDILSAGIIINFDL